MIALHVVTPEGKTLDQEVDEVTLPGLLGEFGVLPGHVPMLSAMKAGVLRYRRGQERGLVAVGPGFAEVDGKDKVVALVQRALPSSRLSSEAADQLLADASERLKGDKSERGSAEADRDFALAQLEALGKKS
ncbi:MAG: ATP synthase F1 subunit epsilon [Myxococcales bacterium]|nr:ATP synthase F1 subunit epsilon [Myxococcales bacterium]